MRRYAGLAPFLNQSRSSGSSSTGDWPSCFACSAASDHRRTRMYLPRVSRAAARSLSVSPYMRRAMRELGLRGDQAAWFAGMWMTSMPSLNLTPAITFGN